MAGRITLVSLGDLMRPWRAKGSLRNTVGPHGTQQLIFLLMCKPRSNLTGKETAGSRKSSQKIHQGLEVRICRQCSVCPAATFAPLGCYVCLSASLTCLPVGVALLLLILLLSGSLSCTRFVCRLLRISCVCPAPGSCAAQFQGGVLSTDALCV